MSLIMQLAGRREAWRESIIRSRAQRTLGLFIDTPTELFLSERFPMALLRRARPQELQPSAPHSDRSKNRLEQTDRGTSNAPPAILSDPS